MRGTRTHTDRVIKAWLTQNWTGDIPQAQSSPFGDDAALNRWMTDKRTVNYINRVGRLTQVISNPRYFREGNT